nr:methyltransferase domain-containing protein [uncultured Methanospirillum sp.]
MDTNTRASITSFKWLMNTDGPETYEQYIVPTWMTDWTPELIKAGSIGPDTRVLDVACGTGIVARMAAEIPGKNGRFFGIDINEGMLRLARRYAAEKGVKCGFYLGNATRMPFSSGGFGTVLCQQGLQFFPDRSAALQEMRRVLAPDGTLAISVWGRAERSPHVGAICEAFTKYLGEDSTTMFRVACSLSNPHLLQRLVEDAGFSNIQIRTGVKTARHPSLAEFLPAYFSIFPVAAQITAMAEEDRTRMFRIIESALGPWKENEGIAVPTENCILTAVKR